MPPPALVTELRDTAGLRRPNAGVTVRDTLIDILAGVNCLYLRDIVHYAAPLGPLGDLVVRFQVRGKLQQIFDYRRKTLERRFRMP